MLKSELENLIKDLKKDLSAIESLKEVDGVWRKYFGGEGAIKGMLKRIKELPAEEKKIMAPLIQQKHQDALNFFREKEAELKK